MKLKMYMRGLGIGIMVTALIMGIATKDGRPLTDAEIKAAAAKLGMVDSSEMKLTDLPQKEGIESMQPDTTADPDGQEPGAEGVSGEGTSPEGAEGPSGAGASPEGAEGSSGAGENPDEAEGPSDAGENPEGAERPSGPGGNSQGAEGPSGSGEESEGTGEPGSGNEPEAESTPAASVTPDPEDSGDTVKITVTRGNGSRSVCNQLAEAGLIEDAAAFDQYLIDSGYSKRISAGTFEIPRNASDEEIAKIISKSR